MPVWPPPAVHVMSKPTGAICNLGCSYCYFLDKEALYADDRFRMSDDVAEAYISQTIAANRGTRPGLPTCSSRTTCTSFATSRIASR